MALIDNLAYGTRKYAKKLEAWSEPIYQYYGFTSVAYLEVTDEKSVINIHTHIKWLENCLDKKYYVYDPHMVDPKNIGSGFTIWSAIDDPEYYDKMEMDAIDNYNMCHGVTYIDKCKDRYKVFGFGTGRQNYNITNKILENPQYIKKFISYLDDQFVTVREELFNNAPDLSVLKGDAYYNQPGAIIVSFPEDEFGKRIQFLRKIGLVDDALLKLTKRELDCLKLYLEGKSAVQTGLALFISPRTVESHIESIKNKLNVHLKKELFERAKILKDVNLI